jgi:ABC-type molybdate transport system substrate-binding protein
MTEAADADLAREFIQYLETPSVKAIFATAGFD